MINKGFIGVFLLLGMAFLAIAYLKHSQEPKHDHETTTAVRSASPDSTQSRIIDFWNYYDRATDLRTSGAYEEALSFYLEALTIEPDHQNSLYYQGNLLLRNGRYEEAEVSWKRLIRVNPSSARAYSQLGTLYSCREPHNQLYDLERAVHHFAQADSLNREETGPLLQLAKIDLLEGRFDGAEKKLEDVISSNFRSTEAIFLKGYLEWKNGNIQQAQTHMQQAVAIVEGTTARKNVGEGDTKPGADSQLPDSYRCSIYSDAINRLLDKTGPAATEPRPDSIYPLFENGLD